MRESGSKKHFDSKKSLWDYVLYLGRLEAKRNRVLNIYAHNHEFDFYGYADLSDKNLQFLSFNPFIAEYRINGKKAINFLDSYGIFKMPLEQLGKLIGLPKLSLPKEYQLGIKISKKRILELRPYVERDVEIVMKAILLLKNKLKDEGISIRRLYTISQIAISYFINSLKTMEDISHIFYNRNKGMLHHPKFKSRIHMAYRGGRCEAFQLGRFKAVDYIDVNNLYGFCSIHIRFPDLTTERLIFNPLKYFRMNDIFDKIGISKVLIYNKDDDYGLLPIVTSEGNYYPKSNSYILGTYTNHELKEALRLGYKIIAIEWSILYEEGFNPYKIITPRLYQLRKKQSSLFNDWFFKEMQNKSYGKLGQSRPRQLYMIDESELANKYLLENYEIMRESGYLYVYKKETKNIEKPYYAPIIPTLINAHARVYMSRMMRKVPLKDLIYMDTDSIFMKKGHLSKFTINENIGSFKVVKQGEELIIVGKKTYAIGTEVKVSGFRKRDLTIDDFRRGEIFTSRMVTLKTAKDMGAVGGFYTELRDLDEQVLNSKRYLREMKKRKLYKDEYLTNINYFVDILEGLKIYG